MGSGPKTTTTNNQQTNTNQSGQTQSQSGQFGQVSGTTSVNPNMPDWYNSFLQGIPQQYSSLLGQLSGQATKPLYGPQQQASFQQNLNQQLGSEQNNLMNSLASRGALNSTRAAESANQLQLGGIQQMGNYLSQVPLLNAQYQQNIQGQLGNTLANAANFKIPIGQTTTMDQLQNLIQAASGTSNAQGSTDTSGTQTQQTSGGLLQSLLGGLLNGGLGVLTGGLSNLAGGGSFFGGQQQAAAPVSTMPSAPLLPSNPYSAMQAPPSLQPASSGFGGIPPWMIPGYGG